MLKEEFSKSGVIYNLYGRPIYSDKSILNKWIQSSAVDYCSLAFLNLIEENNLKPCFFVHDDMVVSCSEESYQRLIDIKYTSEHFSNINLPVEVTKLGP